MKDKFLIALDLDGTLLKEDKTISEKTKKVLDQVRKDSHIVMISTGRPYRSSAMYYRELGLDSPIVNFNGAFVHHPQNPDWENFHEPIALSVVKEIVEICSRHSVENMVAEVIDEVYIHYHNEKLLDVLKLGNPKITTGDLRRFLKNDPTSLLVQGDEESVKKIRAILSEVHAELVDHRNWGAPWHVVEIVKHGINKAIGVQKVADYYRIPRERIIAFGDGDNDIEMLTYAKYGIAMENGIDEVKEVAYEVTADNERDGVARFLEKFFF